MRFCSEGRSRLPSVNLGRNLRCSSGSGRFEGWRTRIGRTPSCSCFVPGSSPVCNSGMSEEFHRIFGSLECSGRAGICYLPSECSHRCTGCTSEGQVGQYSGNFQFWESAHIFPIFAHTHPGTSGILPRATAPQNRLGGWPRTCQSSPRNNHSRK